MYGRIVAKDKTAQNQVAGSQKMRYAGDNLLILYEFLLYSIKHSVQVF